MSDKEQELNWERRMLEKLAFEALAEQRRRRRWGIFFKLLGFAYLGALVWSFGDWGSSLPESSAGEGYTALISVKGVIAADEEAGAESVIVALKRAYEDLNVKGIILSINSPGGSPVQAGMINEEIYRLRATRPELPVAAVVEDVCASGGYYIAVAADNIFVNRASLVGSIGVLMDGFGFVGAMEKLGIERRLLTAGKNKGFLDPFSPQQGEQLVHVHSMLNDIHEQFIDVVRKGRGDRLKGSSELFSGLIWTGQQSIELGLADEFGTVDSVSRDIFNAKEVRDFTLKRSFAERFVQRLGTDVASALVNTFSRVNLR